MGFPLKKHWQVDPAVHVGIAPSTYLKQSNLYRPSTSYDLYPTSIVQTLTFIKAVLPMPWHVREPECENQYTKNIELQNYDVFQFILSYNKKNPKKDTISKLKNSLKPYQRQKTKN